MAEDYFSKIFHSDQPSTEDISVVTSCIGRHVNPKAKMELDNPFMAAEFREDFNDLASNMGAWLHEYQSAQSRHVRAPIAAISSLRMYKWEPPPMGKLKLNADAAIFNAQKLMGLGAVLRDD